MQLRNRWITFVLVGWSATTAFVPTGSALAQANPVSFGVLAGATKGLDDLGDIAKLGYHAGALVQWNGPTLPFGVRGEGVYHRFTLKDVPSSFDASLSIIAGTLNGVFTFSADKSAMIVPYAIGGLGVYRLKFNCDDCGADDLTEAENKFGLNGGAGISVPLSGFSAFVEARYHHVFTDDESLKMIPVSVGLRFHP